MAASRHVPPGSPCGAALHDVADCPMVRYGGQCDRPEIHCRGCSSCSCHGRRVVAIDRGAELDDQAAELVLSVAAADAAGRRRRIR